ncbi:MAG TPA: flagellar basal body protein [Haliangiales bacterium]|nr:flagellar basal body protein [Haliangiales bacterium]
MRTLFKTVDALEEAMTFHRERHSVLAGNVANIDTPGYRPMDLERPAPMEAVSSPEGETEAAPRAGGPHGTLSFDDAGQSASADGNHVNLERELAKMDANRVRYATASELVSRRLALLRYAAGDGT